ncbi:MAG: hypothetical protein H7A52_13560 [Akkermansiaceae bacterium]|nr:hypothetical protein [Akkermansiaceae bacterium]
MKRLLAPLLAVALVAGAVVAQQNQKNGNPAAPQKAKATKQADAAKKAKARKGQPPVEIADAALLGEVASLKADGKQIDFPDICEGPDGAIWLGYIEHSGSADTSEADVLRLGKFADGTIDPGTSISEPGVIHQPAVAVDGAGAVWCFWGQTGDDNVVNLHARSLSDGKPGEATILSRSSGSDTFADAGTDAAGRVWVVWQSMRAGEGDIFTRYFDPKAGEWSKEIAVTTEKGGDWEPRVAFDAADGAWIVYDSSRGNEFNLYLARVGLDGAVETKPIAHTPRYEARAAIAASADGKSLWIAAERGRPRWGLDVRGHDNDKGLNAQKEILFGRYDIGSDAFTEIPLGAAGRPRNAVASVNLPTIGLDASGNPWIAYRYYDRLFWEIAVTRHEAETGSWSAPARLSPSHFGQDRRAFFAPAGPDGGLGIVWPSDERTNKTSLHAGVHLARLDTAAAGENLPKAESKPIGDEPFSPSQNTPERPADDRHFWTHDGVKYGLYWGDVHRHTDVSNCRTGFDGCINENFRYAWDMAKLDFLGTSDHTDIVKIYDPYEWWHNQRMADVFYAPGQFHAMYTYEREQRWPWGHRNVVFAERGGPIVYIKRVNYRNSPWQKLYPLPAGLDEVSPKELWRVLQASGKVVGIVSHTGATGMGTDWGAYGEDGIDNTNENLVEIYQGARVSYEGLGAPQPTAGLRPNEKYTADSGAQSPDPPSVISDFGKHNAGVYQNALALGHKLGVFASSDHISQHVSYGGVYVKGDYTRESIIEAFNARRSMAATDKIYLEFTCNGRLLGSIFDTAEKPAVAIRVDGTAPIKRVTLIRNENDYRVFPGDGTVLEKTFTDESPEKGENRYYIRVEQEDGNMAWSSPVWVTYTGN